jgi:hypothetical protein
MFGRNSTEKVTSLDYLVQYEYRYCMLYVQSQKEDYLGETGGSTVPYITPDPQILVSKVKAK